MGRPKRRKSNRPQKKSTGMLTRVVSTACEVKRPTVEGRFVIACKATTVTKMRQSQDKPKPAEASLSKK